MSADLVISLTLEGVCGVGGRLPPVFSSLTFPFVFTFAFLSLWNPSYRDIGHPGPATAGHLLVHTWVCVVRFWVSPRGCHSVPASSSAVSVCSSPCATQFNSQPGGSPLNTVSWFSICPRCDVRHVWKARAQSSGTSRSTSDPGSVSLWLFWFFRGPFCLAAFHRSAGACCSLSPACCTHPCQEVSGRGGLSYTCSPSQNEFWQIGCFEECPAESGCHHFRKKCCWCSVHFAPPPQQDVFTSLRGPSVVGCLPFSYQDAVRLLWKIFHGKSQLFYPEIPSVPDPAECLPLCEMW